MSVILKSPEEIECIRSACQIAKRILDHLTDVIDVGVTTAEIDKICVQLMKDFGVISATLGFRGYPNSICTSLNHVVCHGIPNHKRLKNGDILNVDVAVIKDGWYGDMSRMFCIGSVSPLAKKLVDTCLESLNLAISKVKPDVTLGDIGYCIQSYAEQRGFSVVRDYCGHGLGRSFHEYPQVLHYGNPNTGLKLQSGMTFTIEPMLNIGKPTTKVLADQWTVTTKDKKLSAQWEHTIAVTDEGVDILSA